MASLFTRMLRFVGYILLWAWRRVPFIPEFLDGAVGVEATPPQKPKDTPEPEPERWALEKVTFLSLALDEKRNSYRCGHSYVSLEEVPAWTEYFNEHELWLRKLAAGKLSDVYDIDADLNDRVSIWRGDITTLEIHCIVNAANKRLLGGGGVDGVIHKAAGPLLVEECETLHGCETGQSKITGGYCLPAKYVIHTVGPIEHGDKLLIGCYLNSLNIMKNNGLRSIAFPCISTGIYGFPNERAANLALKTARTFLEENKNEVDRIIFCLFLPLDVEIYERLMQKYFPVRPFDPRPQAELKVEELPEVPVEKPSTPEGESLTAGSAATTTAIQSENSAAAQDCANVTVDEAVTSQSAAKSPADDLTVSADAGSFSADANILPEAGQKVDSLPEDVEADESGASDADKSEHAKADEPVVEQQLQQVQETLVESQVTTSPEKSQPATETTRSTEEMVTSAEELAMPRAEAEKSTEETEKSTEETEKSTEETEQSTEESEQPTKEAEQPTKETEKPMEETKKSTEETVKLVVQAEQLIEETEKSAEGTEKPAEEAEQPITETEKPAEEIAMPSVETGSSSIDDQAEEEMTDIEAKLDPPQGVVIEEDKGRSSPAAEEDNMKVAGMPLNFNEEGVLMSKEADSSPKEDVLGRADGVALSEESDIGAGPVTNGQMDVESIQMNAESPKMTFEESEVEPEQKDLDKNDNMPQDGKHEASVGDTQQSLAAPES